MSDIVEVMAGIVGGAHVTAGLRLRF